MTSDRAAAELIVAKLGDDSLAVQREAARALGRLRNPRPSPRSAAPRPSRAIPCSLTR